MREIILIALVLLASTIASDAQWVTQTVNTTASFRGLSVVDEKIVWASGTAGTVIRSVDGGKSWQVMVVPEAQKLDFRDIEAFDANTAYILSIGNGDSSRIYKTADGGKTWTLQFKNENPKAFFDAIACWDRSNCIAMSDPVDGHYLIVSTSNGGERWERLVSNQMAAAKDGEAAFAASGTCLITQGSATAFLVSGGTDARVFRSIDRGKTWAAVDAPMLSGTAGSGIFSIAMFDANRGVIVGGNYEKPGEANQNLALTTNGGVAWKSAAGLGGYRSGVSFIERNTLVAVGTNGSDISRNGGKIWKTIDRENYNSVASRGRRSVWAVGPNGLVARLK